MKRQFIPLHCEDLKSASYQSTINIEFGTYYRVYVYSNGKFRQFDTKLRFFMWCGDNSALLVAIHEPKMVVRMCNVFTKVCEPVTVDGKVYAKLYKNARSSSEQFYIRKVGA
jgi:hypothetical protein